MIFLMKYQTWNSGHVIVHWWKPQVIDLMHPGLVPIRWVQWPARRTSKPVEPLRRYKKPPNIFLQVFLKSKHRCILEVAGQNPFSNHSYTCYTYSTPIKQRFEEVRIVAEFQLKCVQHRAAIICMPLGFRFFMLNLKETWICHESHYSMLVSGTWMNKSWCFWSLWFFMGVPYGKFKVASLVFMWSIPSVKASNLFISGSRFWNDLETLIREEGSYQPANLPWMFSS